MHATVSRLTTACNRFSNPAAAGRSARVLPFLVILAVAGAFFQTPVVSAGDLILEDCIRAALAQNPNTGATALRIEAARASITQAKSAYYPLFMLSGDYRLTDNPTQAFMMQLNQRNLNISDPGFNPNDPSSTDNLRLSLGLKYSLYDRGRRSTESSVAELGRDATAEQLAAVQNELIYQVTRGYYSLLQVQDLVVVQKETVASLEENLRVASERYRAGSVVKTDVLNLEVRLAQAREDLIRAQNGVQLAIASLNTAIGAELVESTSRLAPAGNQDQPVPAMPDPAVIENRPELRAAKNRTRIRQQESSGSRSEYYPQVNAYGSYDVDTGDFDDFEGSYVVGVMAEWEFFDGFRTSGGVSRAESEWRAARQDEKNLRNQLILDLRRAHIQVRESHQRLEVTRKSVESAEEALRITRVRYGEGAANITELLTAQVGLTASQSRSVAAFYDYQIALANLERSEGKLVRRYVGSQ
jgi:outer membrane protein TolC